jgi:hypothetical protein
MSNLEEAGYEVIRHKIIQVRLQFHAGDWYVEYRRPAKYFFDKWWWFDDSKHKEYKDAYVRAQELAAEGAYKEIKHKQLIFNANLGE